MGMIWGKRIDHILKALKTITEGMIVKDKFFKEVPELKQKDLHKWSNSIFDFKFKDGVEWYLGQFYKHEKDNKVTLTVTKWVDK